MKIKFTSANSWKLVSSWRIVFRTSDITLALLPLNLLIPFVLIKLSRSKKLLRLIISLYIRPGFNFSYGVAFINICKHFKIWIWFSEKVSSEQNENKRSLCNSRISWQIFWEIGIKIDVCDWFESSSAAVKVKKVFTWSKYMHRVLEAISLTFGESSFRIDQIRLQFKFFFVGLVPRKASQ